MLAQCGRGIRCGRGSILQRRLEARGRPRHATSWRPECSSAARALRVGLLAAKFQQSNRVVGEGGASPGVVLSAGTRLLAVARLRSLPQGRLPTATGDRRAADSVYIAMHRVLAASPLAAPWEVPHVLHARCGGPRARVFEVPCLTGVTARIMCVIAMRLCACHASRLPTLASVAVADTTSSLSGPGGTLFPLLALPFHACYHPHPLLALTCPPPLSAG